MCGSYNMSVAWTETSCLSVSLYITLKDLFSCTFGNPWQGTIHAGTESTHTSQVCSLSQENIWKTNFRTYRFLIQLANYQLNFEKMGKKKRKKKKVETFCFWRSSPWQPLAADNLRARLLRRHRTVGVQKWLALFFFSTHSSKSHPACTVRSPFSPGLPMLLVKVMLSRGWNTEEKVGSKH